MFDPPDASLILNPMEPNIEQLLSSSFSEIARETGLGEPTVTAADRTFSPDTVVNIGITGDWHGFFFLQAKAGDLNSLMKTMVEHLGYASGIEDPTLFTEAFQELANQTSGRLMMHFANAGINGNITPPHGTAGQKPIS